MQRKQADFGRLFGVFVRNAGRGVNLCPFDARVVAPPGYALLRDWARACGRSPSTARIHLAKGHIPEAIKIFRVYTAVPVGIPWPAKATGRPRKPQPQDGAPGQQPGAGESLGALPATEAA